MNIRIGVINKLGESMLHHNFERTVLPVEIDHLFFPVGEYYMRFATRSGTIASKLIQIRKFFRIQNSATIAYWEKDAGISMTK